MYSEFNTVVRKKVNSTVIQYKSGVIPLYFEEEFSEDKGAHGLVLTYTNQPSANEIGFNASQEMNGFIQFKLKVPASDSGINYELNAMAGQLMVQFPRSSFVENDLKVEWLNTERNSVMRVEGHYCITMRVNYRIFAC